MKKVIKKIISFTLVLSMVLAMVTPASAQETTNVQNEYKEETITYLQGKPGDSFLCYLQEKDGEVYKIEETVDENFMNVYSVIYKENVYGEFELYATQNLEINEVGKTTLNIVKDGICEMEYQELPCNGVATPFASYRGGAVSAWVKEPQIKGNTKIVNYTVSAVTAVIFYIAGTSGGFTGGLAAAAGAIASKVVDEKIPILYYKQNYAQRTSLVIPNMVVASKWDTWYYEDSRYSYYLGYTYDEVYLEGYEE